MKRPRTRPIPRIRTVLLITHLVILVLPVFGLVVMRFYEDELIRRTETELYAQGAFVVETYRVALLDALREQRPDAEQAALVGDFGVSMSAQALAARDARRADQRGVSAAVGSDLEPIAPTLSRRSGEVAPPAPSPGSGHAVDTASEAAGAFVMPILQRAKNVTLAGIRVVDFNGTEVANTRGDHSNVSLLGWSEVERALGGEVVSQLRRRLSDEPRPALASPSRGTRVRVFVAMPIVEGDRVLGAVVLSRTPLSLSKGLYNNRIPLFWAGLGLVLVVMLLSRFTSRTLARPLDRLVLQAARIARREPEGQAPLDRPGTDEARRISEAMAVMARELGDRESYIRAFATSVSHEFKTPLTSMRGAVELLQDHWTTMSEAERERFLAVLESERARLERLVQRVLELSRADVARPGDERSDANAIVRQLQLREEQQGRVLTVRLPAASAWTAMGDEVLDTVVSALVANARQHGGPDVRVEVTSGEGAVCVTVSDDGAGVSEANAARVFENFFTTDREGGGTGIGLAIVRTLCASHAGSVTLSRVDGRTRFEVRLPAAAETK